MCIRDSISYIIWNLIHFFPIASTAFGARGLLAIYFPILLIYSFPLLGTTGRLAWCRLTYPKHLTGYGTRHCSPSSLPLGFLLLFAYVCLVFSQIAQYRLLYGATSSFSVNCGVPQGSVLSPTLFLLFINDLLTCTSNSIHSYADDSTLHSS